MEKVTIVCYPKCTTCKKAEDWLKGKGIEYNYRHIKEENPSVDELKDWVGRSGLPMKRFFNTSGVLYKEYNMKEKVVTLPEEELLDILASNGMMVKRPILLAGDKVLVGFKETEWNSVLG